MTRLNRVYMVRHGRASAGWDTALDPGLDEMGQAQAREAADQLQSLQLDNLITSPLLRCQQTAAPLAQMWNVAPQVRAGTRILVVRGLSVDAPSGNGPVAGNGRDWLIAQCEAAGAQVESCVAYERSAPRWF